MHELIEPESDMDLVSPSNGHVLHFHNLKDGTLSVVSQSADRLWVFFGQGTWKVDDQGRYCIDMAWSGSSEKRCRVAYRYHDGLYLGGADLTRNSAAQLGLFRKAETSFPSPVKGSFIGNWKAVFRQETRIPLGAEVNIPDKEQIGTWRTYSLALMKDDPCVGHWVTLKVRSRSDIEITLEVAAADVVSGCTNSQLRLV